MLKRYYSLYFGLVIVFYFSIKLFATDIPKTIQTPRGTEIPDCYECDEFEDPNDVAAYNNQYDLLYSNDELIANSSRKYNCHGYAWHMIGDNCPTDSVWMGLYNPAQIDSYWVDESYSEVDPSYAEECENEIIIDYTVIIQPLQPLKPIFICPHGEKVR